MKMMRQRMDQLPKSESDRPLSEIPVLSTEEWTAADSFQITDKGPLRFTTHSILKKLASYLIKPFPRILTLYLSCLLPFPLSSLLFGSSASQERSDDAIIPVLSLSLASTSLEILESTVSCQLETLVNKFSFLRAEQLPKTFHLNYCKQPALRKEASWGSLSSDNMSEEATDRYSIKVHINWLNDNANALTRLLVIFW